MFGGGLIASAMCSNISSGGGGEDEGWKYPEWFPEVPDPDDYEITMLLEITEKDINRPTIVLTQQSTSYPDGSYGDITIDWGDGLTSQWTSQYAIYITHFYSTPGFYIVRFTGLPTTRFLDFSAYTLSTSFEVFASGGNFPDVDVIKQIPKITYVTPNHDTIRVMKVGAKTYISREYSSILPNGLVYLKYLGTFTGDFSKRATMLSQGLYYLYSLQKFEVTNSIHEIFDNSGRYFSISNTKLKDLDFLKDFEKINISNGDNVFNMSEISFPNATELIQLGGYNNFTVKRISMPKITSVPRLGFYAFCGAEEIYLPSCTEIDKTAFQECTSLRKLTLAPGCKLNGNTFSTSPLLYPKPKE